MNNAIRVLFFLLFAAALSDAECPIVRGGFDEVFDSFSNVTMSNEWICMTACLSIRGAGKWQGLAHKRSTQKTVCERVATKEMAQEDHEAVRFS